MPTKRTPINRPALPRITQRAVKLWERMQQLECTCAPRDWNGKYWEHEFCAGCQEWGRLDRAIHHELQLKLWENAVKDPDASNPYPVGSYAHEQWERDLDAETRWHALEVAAQEMRERRRG
jgi:hypothetical protein